MTRRLVAMKHKRTGEVHRTFRPEDYDLAEWEPTALAKAKRDPDQKRRAAVAAMTPVERFDALRAEIVQLQGRVAELERQVTSKPKTGI